MEKWIVESMMSQMRGEVKNMYNGEPHFDLRCALAYERLYEKNSALENFQRERQRLVRIIDRTTRLLKDLQDQNPPAASDDGEDDEICGNEPERQPNSDPPPASDPAAPSETAKIWSPPVCMSEPEPPEVLLVMAA